MKLGKFEILEELGHGGFGTVYRANDTTLDRIVALKVLHPQYLSDQKFIESFKREARMMARVSHPNVVQLFEVGDLKGQIYIAMQYFDAGNLDQRIQSGGPLPLKDAIRMLSQTARGLEAGHKIGLVHRDVKPANILFNREGYIAISDFGVAKSIQQSSPETTNSYNQFAGTPYYIPPELWKSEGNPSPAADVYSLACVFYEALTGEVLFAGDTYEHVLTRHVLEAPVFSKAFPECLVDTLNVALAKNPSDRYQTMNDFLAAVRGALEKQARKPARTETTQEQTSGIEELPKPLAPGEITFADLVRRSQHKTTPQRPVTKPAPISQPTPPPVRPAPPKPISQPTPAPVRPVIPAPKPQIQQQSEEVKARPQTPADATAEFASPVTSVTIMESSLEGEAVLETSSEMSQEAQSVTPEDRYTQAGEQRDEFVSHNAPTSRFDQYKDKTAKKDPTKKRMPFLLLAFGGIAVIALVSLALLGPARNLFGGKPSATPAEALVATEPPMVGEPTEAPISLLGSTVISSSNADLVEQLVQFGKGMVNAVAYSPDGSQIAVASNIGFYLINSRTLEEEAHHVDDVYIRSIAWSPDGKTLALGSRENTLILWDVGTEAKLRTLKGHAYGVNSVAWSPDGKTLASGGNGSRTIILWDAGDGSQLRTLEGHTENVFSIAWSPDGKTLASGSFDSTIILWDADSGSLLHTLEGHTAWVSSVAWSPDGKTLASGSYDGTIILWDAESRRQLRILEGHSRFVRSVAWSPDGKTLASGSYDGTIILWDAGSGIQLRTLKGHTESALSVAWSPDGKTLASGSVDNSIILWGIP